MNEDDSIYTPCLCPDCGEPAAINSEMCGGCEWLGCTDTRARHG